MYYSKFLAKTFNASNKEPYLRIYGRRCNLQLMNRFFRFRQIFFYRMKNDFGFLVSLENVGLVVSDDERRFHFDRL